MPNPTPSRPPHGSRFKQAAPRSAAHGRSGARAARRAGVQPAYRRSQNSSRRSSSKKSSPAPVVIGIIAAVAVVALFAVFVVPSVVGMFTGESGRASVDAGQEVSVSIPEGSGGDAIAQILSDAHVVEDPKEYYAAVKKLNADTQIKPGDYVFTTGQDPVEVVTQLVNGPNADGARLVIPEGLTVAQVAQLVEDAYGISADDFSTQAKASNYVSAYPFLEGAVNDSLEGFLCPKTYTFTGTPTADQIIRAMLDQYKTEMASFDFDAARTLVNDRYGLDMSDYDFLILASVVEREGLNDEQRAKVASTFYNRLQQGMRLQSDATLMYVTGGEVSANDIQNIDSPYNSYDHDGLPPTPICSPSANSITATLEPAQTDYLYFYITTDGEWFSRTHDEHLAAIEENR